MRLPAQTADWPEKWRERLLERVAMLVHDARIPEADALRDAERMTRDEVEVRQKELFG